MSSDNFKKWVEAGKILELNPNAKIKCPVCSIGTLIVKDELIEESSKLDRYMICDNCGKWNVMTMEIPPDYPRSQKSRTYNTD